jgi:hypothetical protein
VPAEILPGHVENFQDIKANYFPNGVGAVDESLTTAPASVWQFPGSPQTVMLMHELMVNDRQKVLVEVDDNYLVPPHVLPPGMKQYQRPWKLRHDGTLGCYSHEMHRLTVERVCHGIIASTPFLAEQYAKVTDVPIWVCPNSVSLRSYPGDDHTVLEDRPQRILYAGSASHQYDVSLVARGLDWAWRDGMEIWMMGLKKDWKFPYYQVPWVDSVAEYHASMNKLLQPGDVGLCPLKRSDWHDSKSDIKAIEYTMAGGLPIVQRDSPCYRDWVDVVPSATTPKEWEKLIRWAAANRDEVADAWAKAHAFLMENKLIENHVDKWREAVS